jgi:hypothetical protein
MNFKKKALYINLLHCISLYTIQGNAQISGSVFRDFNANGQRNNTASFTEPFVSGVTVQAVDNLGVIQTQITNVTGAYSFVGLTLPIRIEFSGFQIGDFSAPMGTGSKSNVQFYTAASTTAHFGIQYPHHYSQNNPDMVTPCYVNGRAIGAGTEAIVKFPYTALDQTNENTYLAQASDVGSTWGIAYDREKQKIYAAAFVKRHVSLNDNNGDGKEDIGAIYSLSTTGSPALWLDLTTLGIDVGSSLMPTIVQRDLPTDKTDASHDAAVFDLVGKIGLGDLDISDDNQSLYVVNLYDKKVYTINIATKTLIGNGIAIPDACQNGSMRPFALSYHRGKIYVGAICDGTVSNNRADLQASIYRLDGGTFTNLFTFPLTYPKGAVEADQGLYWNAWKSSFYPYVGLTDNTTPIYPQPIFADIEFDVNEELILVFMDRFGHQTGYRNYGTNLTDNTLYSGEVGGDILRATLVNGNYVLENNASAGGITTAGANNGEGPGGGEFYYDDLFLPWHFETVVGGAALWAGKKEVAVNIFDPIAIFSGGTAWMSNVNGGVNKRYEIFGNVAQTFGKANGLGDLELLSNPAPIEIGNYVWRDLDNDGIQDPNERGIAGVVLKLYQNNVLIATATTDATGYYVFSNDNSRTSTTAFIYGIAGLLPNSTYELRIENAASQSALNALNLSAALQNDTLLNPTAHDSDGTLVGANVIIPFSTGNAGANNHNLDIGFNSCPTQICLPVVVIRR